METTSVETPSSQAQGAWTCSVSEDRLATLVHVPSSWKAAGQSFAGRHDLHRN